MNRTVIALVVASLLLACVRNPVTGERQLSLISEAQEIELGAQAAQEVRQSIGLYADPALQSYVSDIGLKMAKRSERAHLRWSFEVVDDASVNAFALPGGHIFVTRGILSHLASEAELAGVLGHEIGHVTARHSAHQLSKATLAQLGVGLGSIFLPEVGQLGAIGFGLLFLKHGRDDEHQADELGIKYSLGSGYDAREMVDVFTTLGRVSGGGGKLPEWLSTHPNPENRVEKTRAHIAQLNPNLGQAVVNAPQYHQRINGIVFGDDPRQGYFQGQTFFHPTLRFRFDLPTGFEGQNLPQAVMGMTAKKDGAIQLALAKESSPDAASTQFFGQKGISPVPPKLAAPNPLPSVGGYFTAQTEQGVLEGLASFISYGGKTYALLGITPKGKLSAYDAAFRTMVSSFRELTDPAALNVKPAKLEVVTLPRAMSLREFNQAYPSTIPLEKLAVLNGVAVDGQLAQGTLAKRVVGGR